jgi:hypothetical protein
MRAEGINTPFTSTGERTAIHVKVQGQTWSSVAPECNSIRAREVTYRQGTALAIYL